MKKGSFESRVLGFGLMLAIVPVFMYLVISGSNLFIPHEDFNELRNECFDRYAPRPVPVKEPDSAPYDEVASQEQRKCLDAVDELEKQFYTKQFAVGVVAGIASLFLGVYIAVTMYWFLGMGFVIGGFGSIIFGISMGADAVGEAAIFFGLLFVLASIVVLSIVFGKKLQRT